MEILIYIYIFIVGIIIGSFLNVCIYRIPAKESIVKGSSHCMSCGHKLMWLDLFPLFSWLFLRGKCRYCGAKISKRYPIIESITGILFVLAFLKFPLFDKDLSFQPKNLLNGVIYCAFFAVLVVVSMIDFDTKEIPDRFHLIILALGIISFLTTSPISLDAWHSRLIGLGIVSLPLCLLSWLTDGIGEGDAKLTAVAGFLIGGKAIVFAFVVAAIIASIYGVVHKIRSKENEIPFGPFLSIGIVAGVMLAEPVVSWYFTLFNFNTIA